MPSPLEGIRVLDLSRGTAGPMTSMVLTSNGADVIKIDPPGGDKFASQLGYHSWQRGKRNAVFDLKDNADRESFLNLVKTADVVLESYAPGVTTRLGIDYDTLAKINPRLVYCSITGYGRDNEWSDRPAYDALVAARLGFQYEQRGRVGGIYYTSGAEIPFEDFDFDPNSVEGPRNEDRDGPLFSANAWPSAGTTYNALIAISAALYVRETTGRGQLVETSLLRGALTAGIMAYSRADKPDAPHFASWISDSRTSKGEFECKDGRWVTHCTPNPSFVYSASEGDTIKSSKEAQKMTPRQDPDRIMPNFDDIMVLNHHYPQLAESFKRFTADEWAKAGSESGQCLQKVRSPEEGFNDPGFLQDGCIVEIEDDELGTTRQPGVLFNLEKNPVTIKGGVAKTGEHTEEIKREAEQAKSLDVERSTAPAPKQPLAGITVLDLGMAIAAPFSGQLLSDLGADVIKINATYDWFWHSTAIAMCSNRGKRSIAVDMQTQEGVEIIQKLVEKADVLLHNMRYKAVEGKGLDYESLKKINPRLIYCHTRGFEKGPRELLPGNDQSSSALVGTQWEDGGCSRGGRPYWTMTTLGDTGNGCLATIAILQALRQRELTGEGQFVDTSIVNAHLLNTSHVVVPAGEGSFDRPHLSGDGLGFAAGYRLYKTADEYLCVVAHTECHWSALLSSVLGADSASEDRFATAEARKTNNAELEQLLEQAFAGQSASEWFERLDGAGVPCEISDPKFTRTMWEEDSFIRENGWLVNHPHRVVGHSGNVGCSFDLSETPPTIQSGPLIVGERTREILTELGYSEEQQEALFTDKVVADESCYMYDIGEAV
ncbi:CoA transferase [Pseudomaricurvus alkylphenolicus]|uniref:CaiB/BaiF CoA transferase family protein n=1 Tax=Pseudomaricurvus alkylphenolicus TaxID=1306991 RepID=UPI00141FA331|nr:CoA transferase [Pseudomaricurvus alkylphenolicus]NIB38002.1 CoA transferase [Pseudomaricurvus alkylphenolicus]